MPLYPPTEPERGSCDPEVDKEPAVMPQEAPVPVPVPVPVPEKVGAYV
jgi:hypothetical protein